MNTLNSVHNKYDSARHKHNSACNKHESVGHKRKSACNKYESAGHKHIITNNTVRKDVLTSHQRVQSSKLVLNRKQNAFQTDLT